MRDRLRALLRGERRALLGAVALLTGVLAAGTAGVVSWAGASAEPVVVPTAKPSHFVVAADVVVGGPKPHRAKYRAESAPAAAIAAAPLGPAVPAGVAQQFAAKLVAGRGWDDGEFSCLVALWNRESGWNVHAANPNGAYGIPQAYPGNKMGGDWRNDHRVQIRWGIGYIAGRYGTPCGAWGHFQSAGSY